MKWHGFKQFGKELKAILRNKKVLIPVIAVIMVPVMYSAMFLGAFWDPYSKMDQLPVAVVNNDTGTEFQGKSLHIGDNFVDKLKESRKFNWAFVSKEEALQGMKDNKYYMTIEIPEHFSQDATTLTSDQPQPAKLIFLPNESFNFLAGQIGNTAVEQMRAMLNKEVTETYAKTVFEKLEDAADGIVKAGNGAGQIADGTSKAKDGAQLLEQNLAKLTEGTAALQDGAGKLDAAGTALAGGSSELKAGAGKLTGGLTQLESAGAALAEGSASADAGAKQLAAGLAASSQGAAELKAGADGLAAGLDQMAAANPALAESPEFQTLLAASKRLAGGLEQSAAGQKQLAAGADSLEQGVGKLAAGSIQLKEGLIGAKSGAETLETGLGKLSSGASELSSGLSQLKTSTATLNDGSSKLKDGAGELSGGLLTLDNGAQELSTKLNDASSATSDLTFNDDKAEMFAEPIQLQVEPVTTVANYGTGFAPYFLSLGLYVGALLITIVYTMKEPAVRPANGWSWFWSKALTLVLIGVLQALVADAALLFILKLDVQNVPLFILFSIATSITYMMIVQFFVTTMGNPGRFAAIILLILQLTTSAGTFPLELIPGWMQHVTPWLPMTYTVAGLKDVISSGEISRMWSDMAWLEGFTGVFAFLTLAYFTFVHRRTRSGAEPEANAKLTTA
ncbi:YhgE/Pip family protein [Paenibacillus sp. CAU 1782]